MILNGNAGSTANPNGWMVLTNGNASKNASNFERLVKERYNKMKSVIQTIEYILTGLSGIISLCWLMYAAVNGSGHTSIDPLNIVRIQLIPVAIIVVSTLLVRNPLSSKSIQALSIASLLGVAIPVTLEISGVLQEYNSWCKNGLIEPSRIKIWGIVLLLGMSLILALKRVVWQGKKTTLTDATNGVTKWTFHVYLVV